MLQKRFVFYCYPKNVCSRKRVKIFQWFDKFEKRSDKINCFPFIITALFDSYQISNDELQWERSIKIYKQWSDSLRVKVQIQAFSTSQMNCVYEVYEYVLGFVNTKNKISTDAWNNWFLFDLCKQTHSYLVVTIAFGWKQ